MIFFIPWKINLPHLTALLGYPVKINFFSFYKKKIFIRSLAKIVPEYNYPKKLPILYLAYIKWIYNYIFSDYGYYTCGDRMQCNAMQCNGTCPEDRILCGGQCVSEDNM